MAQRLASALQSARGCLSARNGLPSTGAGMAASGRVLSAACCPEDTSSASGAQIIETRYAYLVRFGDGSMRRSMRAARQGRVMVLEPQHCKLGSRSA